MKIDLPKNCVDEYRRVVVTSTDIDLIRAILKNNPGFSSKYLTQPTNPISRIVEICDEIFEIKIFVKINWQNKPDTVVHWMHENLSGLWNLIPVPQNIYSQDKIAYFENESDALLFKLAWT